MAALPCRTAGHSALCLAVTALGFVAFAAAVIVCYYWDTDYLKA
jgi:hypothetical protein